MPLRGLSFTNIRFIVTATFEIRTQIRGVGRLNSLTRDYWRWLEMLLYFFAKVCNGCCMFCPLRFERLLAALRRHRVPNERACLGMGILSHSCSFDRFWGGKLYISFLLKSSRHLLTYCTAKWLSNNDFPTNFLPYSTMPAPALGMPSHSYSTLKYSTT